jgi:hypothetical protein
VTIRSGGWWWVTKAVGLILLIAVYMALDSGSESARRPGVVQEAKSAVPLPPREVPVQVHPPSVAGALRAAPSRLG